MDCVYVSMKGLPHAVKAVLGTLCDRQGVGSVCVGVFIYGDLLHSSPPDLIALFPHLSPFSHTSSPQDNLELAVLAVYPDLKKRVEDHKASVQAEAEAERLLMEAEAAEEKRQSSAVGVEKAAVEVVAVAVKPAGDTGAGPVEGEVEVEEGVKLEEPSGEAAEEEMEAAEEEEMAEEVKVEEEAAAETVEEEEVKAEKGAVEDTGRAAEGGEAGMAVEAEGVEEGEA